MRSYDEIIRAVCEQVAHGIEKCGWDYNSEDAFDECVDMAIDMVVTDAEIDAYPDLARDVKFSIVI